MRKIVTAQRKRKTHNPKNSITLPKDAGPLTKNPSYRITKPPMDKKVENLCDQLIDSKWRPHCARPISNLIGFYLVYKWYPQEKYWMLFYIGKGKISEKLNRHFAGKDRTPIGHYLSSFPVSMRKDYLWLKWIEDPCPLNESFSVEDMITVLTEKYTGGDRPPFNFEPSYEPPAAKKKSFLAR